MALSGYGRCVNRRRDEPMSVAKPFVISKWEVWEAYQQVKANQGAAGVDGQSIAEFEAALTKNLYKLWNRMSSGSYFPPPVRRVEIPKKGGGSRPLGIPTVADRIAQTVVKTRLEPILERHFHPDSYGYRPGRSAHQALAKARERCWRFDWVLDLDIKGFFDNIDHGLLMRAVRKHVDCPWMLLYIERWLTAPVQLPDGALLARDKGTPQGGVVSPLLANLFLHYAFDEWMRRNCPSIPFERYADDIVAHCTTLEEAEWLKGALTQRLLDCSLELHPAKTRIVYCKDANRQGSYPDTKFDFLGYTFRPRRAQDKYGRFFVSFIPAISPTSAKSIRDKTRGWELKRRVGTTLTALAKALNPVIRGWLDYYGRFYRSALHPVCNHINRRLVRWAMRKYKRLHFPRRATMWLRRISRTEPRLFAHWSLVKP